MNPSYEKKTSTSTTTIATPVTSTTPNFKEKTPSEKDLCHSARKAIDQGASRVKINHDEEKNDIISVEDEIYNLAFRPTKSS